MGASYAVIWRTDKGRVCSGRLVLGRRRIRLDGADRTGGSATESFDRADVVSVQIGRGPADRIDGLVSVVIERVGGTRLAIATPTGFGLTHEIADQLRSPADTERAS